MEDADVLDALDRLAGCSWPSSASSSSLSRSGPKILTELSPLTPDSASMTLSRMFCEKFQSMPGSLCSQLGVHRVDQLVLGARLASVPKSQRRQPVAGRPFGQSFSGRSGTKTRRCRSRRVGAVVGPADWSTIDLDLG